MRPNCPMSYVFKSRFVPPILFLRSKWQPGAGRPAPEASRSLQRSLPDPAFAGSATGPEAKISPLRRSAGIFPPSDMQNAPANRGVAYRGRIYQIRLRPYDRPYGPLGLISV